MISILIYIILSNFRKCRKYTKILFPTKCFIIFLLSILISTIVISIREKEFNSKPINGEKVSIKNARVVEEPKSTDQGINTIIKYNGKKYIATFNKNSKLTYGDIVEISGENRNINSYKNPGVFNYLEKLKKENIFGKIQVASYNIIAQRFDFYSIFVKTKKNIKIKFEKNYSSKVSSFLEALVLGDKENLSDSIKQNVQENGLSHILAISGMHIGIVGLLIQKVINIILKDSKKKKIILIIFLILFNCLIGFISSAVRAVLMSVFTITASLFQRKRNIFINISFACLTILIINPYNIVDSGFLLSFGATIGIIYLYPKFSKKKVKNKILKYGYGIFIVTLSVNIFTFPITVYFFKRLSISFFITRFSFNTISICIRDIRNNEYFYSTIFIKTN